MLVVESNSNAARKWSYLIISFPARPFVDHALPRQAEETD
jgi:hypothetical protein